MPSELLQKAILDAEELRGAALRNAESLILEKYSVQIKEAVESILEQGEDPMEPEISMSSPEQSSAGDQLQYAATEDEKLCPCAKENEVVEIKFDNLYNEEAPASLPPSDLIPQTDVSIPSDVPVPSTPTAPTAPTASTAPDASVPPTAPPDEEDKLKEELVEVDEQQLYKMLEDLIVDANPQPTGYMGVPTSVKNDAEMENKAVETTTDKETPAEYKSEKEEKLKRQIRSLWSEKEKMEESNKILVNKIKLLKSKFQESLLLNAKLFYTNRVLKEISLNERQKIQFAESISKVKTVDEAKLIFESLNNVAAQGGVKKSLPATLQESIQKKSAMSTLLTARKVPENRGDAHVDRMQELAGIKKRK